MRKKKARPTANEPLYPADPNFPKTHFFYEYEGERSIDPAVLVEHGILLWHEQIHANPIDDISPIWAFAATQLEKREETPSHSYLEWLRQQVILNALVPESWNSLEPYPYKGLLISALYLQEARRLCREGESERVWHIVVLAYYYLGLNTVKSSSQALALYAMKARSEESELKRDIVLGVLKKLEGNRKITNLAEAKRAVISFIQDFKEGGESVLLNKLRELDSGAKDEALTDKAKRKADDRAAARLERLLNRWASRTGPYPEVAEAFSVYDRDNVMLEPTQARATSEPIEFDAGDYHTRLINLPATNGLALIVHLRHEQTPDHLVMSPTPGDQSS